jgi:hypothetical protein
MHRNTPAGLASTLVAALALLVSGCAGTVKNMRELPDGSAAIVPDANKAVIVFMRPSGLGFGIQSSVFEIVNDRATLVGIVAAKTKLAYRVDPGKRLFMAVGESADFMTAEILPNRTYHVLVTPRMGLWKARFSLDPQHVQELNTPEFKTSLSGCRWVEKTSASDNWALGNMGSIESKRAEYYPKWLQTPEAERQHLLSGDGM